MNRLPIEIENKIWELYYSHIYYVHVISLLDKQIAICNEINERYDVSSNCYTSDILSTEIDLLKFYNNELSKIYEKEEVKRRVFQISFYNFESLRS
jgi:hypothetical protein